MLALVGLGVRDGDPPNAPAGLDGVHHAPVGQIGHRQLRRSPQGRLVLQRLGQRRGRAGQETLPALGPPVRRGIGEGEHGAGDRAAVVANGASSHQGPAHLARSPAPDLKDLLHRVLRRATPRSRAARPAEPACPPRHGCRCDREAPPWRSRAAPTAIRTRAARPPAWFARSRWPSASRTRVASLTASTMAASSASPKVPRPLGREAGAGSGCAPEAAITRAEGRGGAQRARRAKPGAGEVLLARPARAAGTRAIARRAPTVQTIATAIAAITTTGFIVTSLIAPAPDTAQGPEATTVACRPRLRKIS